MKKIATAGALAALLALPASSAAVEPTPTDEKNAAKHCKTMRANSGDAEAFRSAVAEMVGPGKKVTKKNAYGKCVSFQTRQEANEETVARREAKQDCKTEQDQDEQAFRDAHDGKSFSEFYGTNKNGKNAYGKCVSQQARENKEQEDQEDENELNAAEQCDAERDQDEAEFRAAHDGKSFSEHYGTNDNDRNAFGKCVSAKAHEMNDGQEGQS